MEDPYPTFAYITSQIRELYPGLGYVHFVEGDPTKGDSTDFARQIWSSPDEERKRSIFISCKGYTPETAAKVVTEKGGAVAFATSFIGNPDLVVRFSLWFDRWYEEYLIWPFLSDRLESSMDYHWPFTSARPCI